MMRVRLPSTAHAMREPINALPKPTHVVVSCVTYEHYSREVARPVRKSSEPRTDGSSGQDEAADISRMFSAIQTYA